MDLSLSVVIMECCDHCGGTCDMIITVVFGKCRNVTVLVGEKSEGSKVDVVLRLKGRSFQRNEKVKLLNEQDGQHFRRRS